MRFVIRNEPIPDISLMFVCPYQALGTSLLRTSYQLLDSHRPPQLQFALGILDFVHTLGSHQYAGDRAQAPCEDRVIHIGIQLLA